MRTLLIGSVLVVLCGPPSAAQFNVIVHNQGKAAKSAERFAQIALIDKDYVKAYDLMSGATKKAVTSDKMVETIKRMHPRAFPTELKAIEYEPVPGQKAMSIFLKGKAGEEDFFYRFYMVGDAGAGYELAGLFRGSGPYPSKMKKPLK